MTRSEEVAREVLRLGRVLRKCGETGLIMLAADEIVRLRREASSAARNATSFLSEALNSGDGTYKP